MIVVSPWSKGGWVNSQVFDHTSVIRFLEARFARNRPDALEANITPWRRAVTGDLTTAFDFSLPQPRLVAMPSTAAYFPSDLARHPNYVVTAPGDRCATRTRAAVCAACHMPRWSRATDR